MYQVILVTGAGGAVGQYAVEEGIEGEDLVIAADLPGRVPQRFKDHQSVLAVEADLTTPEGFQTLESVVEDVGLDAIINTAAVVDIAQPWDVVEPVNVGLVSKLFELGVRMATEHFVHISSASIYKNDHAGFIRESDKIQGSSPYEWSKIASEEILEALVETQYRMKATVLRPSLIYGPRCRFLGAALAAIPVLAGKVSHIIPGFCGGPRTNWVHCEDVARACVHCMHREDAAPYEIFNICNTEAPGFGDVINLHLEAYGLVTFGKIPLPSPETLCYTKPILEQNKLFDWLVNPVIDFMWQVFGTPSSPLLVKVDKEAVPYAFKHTLFDNTKLLSTGFDLKWSLPAGIQQTVGWYKRFDWI